MISGRQASPSRSFVSVLSTILPRTGLTGQSPSGFDPREKPRLRAEDHQRRDRLRTGRSTRSIYGEFDKVLRALESLRAGQAALPADIAFLRRYALPEAVLLTAFDQASKLGISTVEALIDGGTVVEAAYLDLLADHLGLGRYAADCQLDLQMKIDEVLAASMARGRDGLGRPVLLIAPRPQAIAWLFSRDVTMPGPRIVLATAAEFETLILSQARQAFLHEAGRVAFERPGNRSARSGPGHIMKSVAILVLVLTSLA